MALDLGQIILVTISHSRSWSLAGVHWKQVGCRERDAVALGGMKQGKCRFQMEQFV